MGVVRENGVLWRVSTVRPSESMRADMCIFCCVFRHTCQADGEDLEPVFGKAEMTYLVSTYVCEHPGRILANSVHSFEADVGLEIV